MQLLCFCGNGAPNFDETITYIREEIINWWTSTVP